MGGGRDLFAGRKDGSLFPVAIELNPIETVEGPCVLVSILGTIEHSSAHEEALSRQRLEILRLLAAEFGHDFNNLLGTIELEAELFLTSTSPDREGIVRIKEIVGRASASVRQLMSFAGAEKPAVEPLDLSRLVHQMLDATRMSISKRGLEG